MSPRSDEDQQQLIPQAIDLTFPSPDKSKDNGAYDTNMSALNQIGNITVSSCENIFRSKEEFLFVFGGFNTDGFVPTTEVLDVKRGIWRKFQYCAPAKT